MTLFLERRCRVPKSLAAALALGCLAASPLAADIAVVTGSLTPLEALDEAQARRLWLGEIERVGGIKLTVADRSEGEIRREFYRRVLHKTRGQVKAIRAKRAFQHGFAPPPEFPDDRSVLAWVQARENRLGYIDAEAIGGPEESVKVLLTIEVAKGSDER